MSSPRAATSVGDQHVAAAVGEAHQHLVAVALFHVAVQGERGGCVMFQQPTTSSVSRRMLQNTTVDSGRNCSSSAVVAAKQRRAASIGLEEHA